MGRILKGQNLRCRIRPIEKQIKWKIVRRRRILLQEKSERSGNGRTVENTMGSEKEEEPIQNQKSPRQEAQSGDD